METVRPRFSPNNSWCCLNKNGDDPASAKMTRQEEHLLLHFAGMFGWYQTFPLGLEYDHWVHGFFGFVAALMVLRAYYFYGVYPPAMIAVAAVAVILGFSAFHEIFEYAGALAVGEGEGVLFIGAGDLDEWDTQKDMLNNLIGAILGLSVFYTSKYWRSRRPEGQRREENI